MYKNIVITSVPYTDTNAPIMAPAVLKSVAQRAGVETVTAFDLNAEVHLRLLEHDHRLEIMDFLYYETINKTIIPDLTELFQTMVDRIMSTDPEMVCLSLLTFHCQTSTKWLCFHLKKQFPAVKICIGGTGITGQLANTNDDYAFALLDAGLIDFFIRGDGEESFVHLLTGQLDYPGINSIDWRPVSNINDLPFPDYQDYDFGMYRAPFVGILGSRGCVRQCTFCDIHEYWSKFQYRTGDNIFNEMLHQNQTYGTRHFKFQDSLTNGNQKEYLRLIRLLSEHNTTNPANSLHWNGYWIFRPAAQMSDHIWDLTAQSGAGVLTVGIESLVEKNRYHLKKKFSNADILHGLKMAKKYQIKLLILLLIGYPTETEQDHQESLEWLETHREFANDPIIEISVGGTAAILPNTWLYRHQKQLDITWLDGNVRANTGNNHLWEVKKTNNNYETRLRRMHEMLDVGIRNGYRMHRAVADPHTQIEKYITEGLNEIPQQSNHI